MEIGKLTNVGVLDVSDNMLSGQLPSSLSSCESLEILHLQGNFLEGVLPSSMKDLRGIRDLDLSDNKFSGHIPQFLQGFGNLQHLNLSFNEFWGAVSIEGIYKNASATSVVGNTGLCEFEGGGLSRRVKLMISLVFIFTLLGLVLVFPFFLLRKKRKEVELATLGNSVLQVSYATLLKATDGFSLANLIGAGAFGSVINMLHQGASKSFMAECEALRNIRHRILVKILTSCSSIDFNGNDFKALRLDIAIDIACALDYLHNHCETPIVHCDLKASNVLLDKDFTGHVSDFGLARFLLEPTNSVSRNQSSSIGIKGSVGYAAPEYGMGSEVSTYGDVYSLLLEMFMGKRPTDHIFSDGLNLHNYVKTALPKRVADIADSLVLQGGNINVEESHNLSSQREQKIEGCLTLIFGIAISCLVESPTTRKEISDVASELHSIRDNLPN
ncbi:putative protein kinase RLK-Pelle-LRR-XII-1 family [Rosa chinensis]|uniref:non-specific serine/threonine protein kinase n=1 Tax=Rosa chinensis TaxID=74649 RepID=A0A2P6SHE3_ROSCH|nr:putative protein kinase RLK-Pelle-LRR-XII-1 family [Rosa chinensis]